MVDADMTTDSYSYIHEVKSMAQGPKVNDRLVAYGPGVMLDTVYGLTSKAEA